MPNTKAGRKKIKEWLKETGRTEIGLATAYGLHKQTVNDYLSGKNQSYKANEFILAVIEQYKIR